MLEMLSEKHRKDLSLAASMCEERNPTDSSAAAEALFAQIKADPELFRAIAEPFVKACCGDLIQKSRTDRRQVVWRGTAKVASVPAEVATAAPVPTEQAPSTPHAGRSGVEHLSNANRTLMDGFPLPNGMRLGDATKADLLEAQSLYHKQARGMREKAVFLSQIASKLTGKKRVRDVLQESDLQTLRQDSIEKEAA